MLCRSVLSPMALELKQGSITCTVTRALARTVAGQFPYPLDLKRGFFTLVSLGPAGCRSALVLNNRVDSKESTQFIFHQHLCLTAL